MSKMCLSKSPRMYTDINALIMGGGGRDVGSKIFPGPAMMSGGFFLLKKSINVLNVLSMLIRGVTLTRDWHSGRLAALSPSYLLLSCYVTLF